MNDCQNYVLNLRSEKKQEIDLFEFSIPPIDDNFLEKFKKQEKENCYNWARQYGSTVNEHLYQLFLNTTKLRHTGTSCCESYKDDIHNLAIEEDCKSRGLI